MAVIRKKKGKIILSVLAGAVGMGILCGISFFFYVQKTGVQLSAFFQMENKLEPSVLVCLSQDVSDGKPLTEAALKEVSVQVPEGQFTRHDISEYIGKCLKLSLNSGSILSENLVYVPPKINDDERLLNLSYVKLNEKMENDDYVDIRISFRNGSDYVLLSKKRIVDIAGNIAGEESANALWIQAGEEEILRLASAVVDSFYQEGCEIYAIEYVSEMQEAAEITYPVNEAVRKLLSSDPNIAELAQGNLSEQIRDNLEKELKKESEE